MTEYEITPARDADADDLLRLWHAGWHDAHAHLVPEAILAYRTQEHFRLWLQKSDSRKYVARNDSLLGFVSVDGAELEKLFVATKARGSGVARALAARAEQVIRDDGRQEAELYCTEGNLRAQRFYEREGWRLTEIIEEPLWLPDGVPLSFSVTTRRYVKPLA